MPVSRRRNPKDCEKIPPAKDRKAENWGADWKAREHTKVCDPTKDGGVPVLLLTSRRRNRQRIVRKYPPAKDYGAEKKGYSEGKREHTTVCDRLSKEEGSPFYARKPTPEPAKDYGAETWGAARNEREHTTVCDRTEWAGGQQGYARKQTPEPAKDYGAETWGAARNEREHTTVCDRTEWAGGQQVYARKPTPEPAKDREIRRLGAADGGGEHTKVCDPTKDAGVPVLLLTSRRRNLIGRFQEKDDPF